ncbi:rho guanine nucleotide exchange factor 3-like [Artemia franciscana]|uniref:rho guanine nucleotide exchange factor 3-like n=1 Tax=Artemia franciscana TaxID=6661 RepID=UPI0032DB710F
MSSSALKKRKVKDSDSISLHSYAEDSSEKGGSIKRKRCLAKVTSFANILASPIRPIRKASTALQRSISGVWTSPASDRISQPPTPSKLRRDLTLDISVGNDSICSEISPPATPSGKRRLSLVSLRRMSGVSLLSLAPPTTPYKLAPRSTPVKKALRLWSHTVNQELLLQLDSREIKRQEAIFELYQGEVDLVDDLRMIMHTYHDSLLSLGIITQADAKAIFGDLLDIILVHQELIDDLRATKDSNDVFCSVGYCLSNWTPQLRAYFPYCANQLKARYVLEEKKMKDPKFADFLQRCLDSPFSRRLDLWSFLDVPRGRLVKYPLLIKQIVKYSNESDLDLINNSLKHLGEILERVNYITGLARCNAAKETLNFSGDFELKADDLKKLDMATNIVCEGPLRNINGMKLQCFLFDTCLVVSRPVTQNNSVKAQYLVQTPPIPIEEISVTTMGEKEGRNGHFLSGNTSVKYMFCVVTTNEKLVLFTGNESNRKLWVQSLTQLSDTAKSLLPKPDVQLEEKAAEPKFKSSLISLKRLNKKALKREAKSAPQLLNSSNKENSGRARKRTYPVLPVDNVTSTAARRSKRLSDDNQAHLRRSVCTRSMTSFISP